MMNVVKRFMTEESGQGMTEYGLVIAIVAVLLITVLVGFKDKIASIFTKAGSDMSPYASSTTTTTP